MAGPNFGQSAASYLGGGSISPSFSEKFSSNPAADYLNPDLKFGTDVTGDFNSVADDLSGTGALAGGGSGGGWTFICAPEDVSWNIANDANRIDIFGSNNPPVVAGTKGMRDLTLGNALVEGFVRKVTVEAKIAALEKLTEYSLNTTDGFVSVPVYQVWANSKSYGGSQAYFIIKDVRVKESMRDLQGNATRAYVDISLMQVPAYQVNSGRDQAGEVTRGGSALQQSVQSQANGNVAGTGPAAAGAGSKPGAPGTKPAAGSTAPKPAATTTKPPPPPAKLGERVKVQQF
jgi:hypothetical protein